MPALLARNGVASWRGVIIRNLGGNIDLGFGDFIRREAGRDKTADSLARTWTGPDPTIRNRLQDGSGLDIRDACVEVGARTAPVASGGKKVGIKPVAASVLYRFCHDK